MTAIVGIRVGSRCGFPWMRGRRAHPIEWRGGRGFRRSYKDPDSLPLPLPLPLILILILILAFDVRGPSAAAEPADKTRRAPRSEEHTSELQSLMRISYAVFCLKKKKQYHRSSS